MKDEEKVDHLSGAEVEVKCANGYQFKSGNETQKIKCGEKGWIPIPVCHKGNLERISKIVITTVQ